MLLGPRHLPARCFARADPGDDADFYRQPRKVVHIDAGAIAALTDFLRGHLPPGGAYLDLMSSWRSHLPPALGGRVTGLGMNAAELADNPQLHERVVHDLNAEPRLPFADRAFDAAVCTVSVQYMVRPLATFGEVKRVLKPGAPFIVSFSNRCFPQKAVALWLATTDAQHVELVEQYFAEGWDGVQSRACATAGDDPLYIVWGAAGSGDNLTGP